MDDMVSTPFRRDQLAQFLPNPELIRKFENLSQDVVVHIPGNIDAAVQSAAEAKDDAATAQATGVAAQEAADHAQADADTAQATADRAARDLFGLQLQPRAIQADALVTDASAIIAARIFNR